MVTYGARCEGVEEAIRIINLSHYNAEVRVAGQVEILHQNSIGTLWKLQLYRRRGDEQVGLFGKAGDIVPQNNLLVAYHFLSTISH